jgi:hypothetical protein
LRLSWRHLAVYCRLNPFCLTSGIPIHSCRSWDSFFVYARWGRDLGNSRRHRPGL